jgi:hypothetical protein
MCYYAPLCDNQFLFVTMFCEVWLSASMSESELHMTVFLFVITCSDLLLCLTICCYCDCVLLCAAIWQSVAICGYVLLCVSIVIMCYYALLCDNLLLFVTMCCYAWLSVSMCENVFHVTVFLCVIMCRDFLLCLTMCNCYWDYSIQFNSKTFI